MTRRRKTVYYSNMRRKKRPMNNKYLLYLAAVVAMAMITLIILAVKSTARPRKEVSPAAGTSPVQTEEVTVVEVKETVQPKYEWEQLCYTTDNVNVREHPSVESEVQAVLPANMVFTAYANKKDDEWYYVNSVIDTENSGVKGWVNSQFIKKHRTDYVDIPLNHAQQDLVRETIEYFGLDVDEYFFYGLMYVESRFNNNDGSLAGAKGVMQIIPSTWRSTYARMKKEYPEMAGRIQNDVTDMNSNIIMGIYYIKVLQTELKVDSAKDNATMLLTAYNRGDYNARRYFKKHGTYHTTYSRDVLRAADYIRTHNTWEEGI